MKKIFFALLIAASATTAMAHGGFTRGFVTGAIVGHILTTPRYYAPPVYVAPAPVYVAPPVYYAPQPQCFVEPAYDAYGRYLGTHTVCR